MTNFVRARVLAGRRAVGSAGVERDPGDRDLRFLDEGKDDEGLPSLLDLRPDEVVHDVATLGKLVPSHDGWPSRRHLVDDRPVQLAVEGQGEGARYWRGGHDEQVGTSSLLTEGRALHDAETLLLVDDRDGELRNLDTLLDDGVRADGDVDLSRREHEAHVVLHAFGEASQQKANGDRAFT